MSALLPAAGLKRIEAVVIGASAGGVEAISVLLAALPASSSLSVFVVLHLPRSRPSLLAGIFGPKCALPVAEAQDKEPVQRGAVYLAPPDYHLLIDAGPRLALSADEPVNYSRPAIDVLFESAADVYGERLLAIVLTGGNDDGAAGMEAVLRNGGEALVQDPDTAQVPLMPRAARRRNPGSAVLPLAGIGALLAGLGSHAAAP
ncbi:MAG: chemotaxis protein CheB [Caldimonas sp.]